MLPSAASLLDERAHSTMPATWTLDEVEAVVADYFAMLRADLSGETYRKAQHIRDLQRRIGRNKGSIEFKHQNISAVLHNFRQPYIPGYLPRQNYQRLLERVVLEWLSTQPMFFQKLANGPILTPTSRPALPDRGSVTALVEEPPAGRVEADPSQTTEQSTRFWKTDFVRRDADNRRLGRLGEEFVVEFEQRRLHDDEKRPDLAKQVEWIADTRGDGAGYDISSFNRDESPRLIEVKTTGLGKTFPFMVTANEVRASERKPQDYQLYRVFEFAKAPRLYILRGSLRENCRLEETQYRARPS